MSSADCSNLFFVDHPISIDIDGVKYYYLYDGLGSVTELIDVNENVVNQYRYTPFGESLVREETVYNPYQFTGRRYDAESGMYYYRARMYSPDIGRFMQVDPAGMVDGTNLYAYVGNNPVNMEDPSGLYRTRTLKSWIFVYGYEVDFTRSESSSISNNLEFATSAFLAPLISGGPLGWAILSILVTYTFIFYICYNWYRKGTRIGYTIFGGILYMPKCISYY